MLDPETTPIFENWNDKTRNAPCNPGVPIPENCKDIDPAIVDCVVEELLYYTQLHVDKHNEYRRLHKDTPDLEVDLEIACQAYVWVDWMANVKKNVVQPEYYETDGMGYKIESFAVDWHPYYKYEDRMYDSERHYDYSTGRAVDDTTDCADIYEC